METLRGQGRLLVVVVDDAVAAPRGGRSSAGGRPRARRGDKARPAAPALILIAEDEIVTALHLEGLLSRLGYEVVGIVADARSALATAERQRPDLVLMDIRLRDADGIAVAGELVARLGIRPVYLTAHSDPATRQRAEATRPLGWVLKPAADGDIAAALQEAIAQLRTA